MEDYTSRDECPLCNSEHYKDLFIIPHEVFISTNITLDEKKMRESGLLDLDPVPLAECTNCGMRYIRHILSPKWNSIFWTQVYLSEKSKEKIYQHKKIINTFKVWSNLFKYQLQKTLSSTSIFNVLDFGCGWGDFMHIAKSESVQVYGIEVDKDKIAFAQSRNLTTYDSLDKVDHTIKFDIFHSDQVFEHLENPNQHLKEIQPYLSKEFTGYIGVPNYSDKRIQKTKKLIKQNKLIDKDLIPWDHYNYFSPKKLYDFITQHGFEVFDITTGKRLKRWHIKSTNLYFRHPR